MDAGCILALANPPVVVGDEVWVYYTSVNAKHGAPMPPERNTIVSVSWRLDGIVSLDAGPTPSAVETIPLGTDGDRLEVNVDASNRSLRVEAVSVYGTVLPGVDVANSEEIRGDHVRHTVT